MNNMNIKTCSLVMGKKIQNFPVAENQFEAASSFGNYNLALSLADLVDNSISANSNEIRIYAEAMLETVKKWVPITHSAFLDYRVGAAHISGKGLKIIKSMLSGKEVKYEESGLGKREWNELMEVLELQKTI